MSTSTSIDQASITVLYFAAASTETGRFEETIALSDLVASSPTPSTATATTPTLSLLEKYLTAKYHNTELANVLASSAWSLNEEMVSDDDHETSSGTITLKDGDVVGVIPPVSGG